MIVMKKKYVKGLVSIITSSYNCADYIGETIESIQAQTYESWELLITDDCSTDNTLDIINEYASRDSRIKVFSLWTNGGAGAARNNSIKYAEGRYIAFCDSDDKWLPEKLEQQLNLMARNRAACCYGSYYEIDEAGQRLRIIPSKSVLTLKEEKHANKIGMLTGIYDTLLIGEKIYMPLIRKRQDWAMWLKVLLICGSAVGVQEPIAEYRIRPNSLSRNKLSMIKYNAAIYELVFGYPHFWALIYTFCVNIPTYLIKKNMCVKIEKMHNG